MRKLVLILATLMLGSCSLFTAGRREVEIQPPPKVTHLPQQKPKKMQRELGSLWSDDSHWNQMYSPTQTRAPGDIVTIKIDKKFMTRLEQAIQRPTEEQNLEPVVSKEKKKETDKGSDPSKQAGESTPPAMASSTDPKSNSTTAAQNAFKTPDKLEVTIIEALPRGLYRVAANHGFKPTHDAPFVYVQGMIREKEISSDDSASSDALLNLKFESIYRDMKVTTYGEEEQP